MTQPEFPPEGWFPDPQNSNQLRYWDGAAWTEHVAPFPVAEPTVQNAVQQIPVESAQAEQAAWSQQDHTGPEQQAFALQQPQQPQQASGRLPYGQQFGSTKPQKPTAWTKRTLVVLFVCIALVIGSMVASSLLIVGQRDNHRAEAQETLDKFIAAATVGDDAWRQYASESLLQKVPVGAPIYGEAKTGKALELSVDASLGELEFHTTDRNSPPDREDTAVATMTVTYNFVFDGKQHASEAQQKVWLTRPFYFGTELPQTATEGGEPSSVGPWRVTSFTYAEEPSDLMKDYYYSTDLVEEYDEVLDEDLCYSSLNIMQEIATFARVDGDTRSSCQVGDGSGTLVGDDVDRELAAAEFPVLENEMTQDLYSVPELTRVPQYPQGHPLPPFQQYVIATSEGQYVFTVALVEVGEGLRSHTGSGRFISVQLAEETEASNE